MKVLSSGFLQKWKEKTTKEKLIIFGVLGFAIIVSMVLLFPSKKQADSKSSDDVQTYVQSLENKLVGTLKNIQGVGSVKVMITVSSGMQSIPATESTTSGVGEGAITTLQPVIVNGKPVIVGEKYPEIVGAIIVAEGAEQLRVKMQLSLAAATVLGISEKSIQIFSAN